MITAVLSKFDLQTLKTGLYSFWAWWAGELSDIVPPQVKKALSRDATRLEVNYGPKTATYKISSPDGLVLKPKKCPTENLPKANLSGALKQRSAPILDSVEIYVDPCFVFMKEVSMPLAHKKSLRQILALQLDRHFPLAEDHVSFTHVIETEDEKNQNFKVSLFILKPSIIAPVLKFLENNQVCAKKLIFRDKSRKLSFDVPLPKTLAGKNSIIKLAKSPLFLSLAFWALLFLGYPFYLGVKQTNIQTEVAEIQAELSAVASSLVAFEAQTRKEQELMGVLKHPGILLALNEMAGVLPKDAWVEDFSLEGDEIILSGFHPDPARIVGVLETSPLFRDVELPSVTEISGQGENSRFRISLKIVESGEDNE